MNNSEQIKFPMRVIKRIGGGIIPSQIMYCRVICRSYKCSHLYKICTTKYETC